MAGKIKYIAPVENASGKIMGKKSPWMAVTRTKGNRVCGCAMQGKRSTKPGVAELQRRDKFAQAAKQTKLRLNDPEFMDKDMLAFSKQTRYTTVRNYVFAQVYASL